MKPNFQKMTKSELKAYVLKHKDDIEATRHLFRRRALGQEIKRYPPLSKDGIPIEENIQIMEDAIQKHIEKGNKVSEQQNINDGKFILGLKNMTQRFNNPIEPLVRKSKIYGDKELTPQLPMTSKTPPRLTRKVAFYTGVFLGTTLGLSLFAGGSFLYLLVSQDVVSIKDGQVSFNKSVTSTAVNSNTPINGDNNTTSDHNAVANSGDNSQVVRDPKESFNKKDSPSIVGDNNSITIVANRDLPGFDEKSYIVAPPSDLSKYTQASDFQPDSLIQSASDTGKIRFQKQEIIILGKPYTSFFDINYYANESRFVFKMDGTQKAAFLQFGLPDLTTGSTTNGLFTVKIAADGQLLWAAECRRSQGNQIFSVPLNVTGKRTLSVEVTSNGKNESNLFFTQARILKD